MRFLVAVDLADLDLGAFLRVLDAIRHSAMFLRRIGERVALVISPTCRRPTCTQSPFDPGLFARELQPHQLALRVGLAPDQRLLADEVILLALQRHRETDAGLEGIGLVAELRSRRR